MSFVVCVSILLRLPGHFSNSDRADSVEQVGTEGNRRSDALMIIVMTLTAVFG